MTYSEGIIVFNPKMILVETGLADKFDMTLVLDY